MEGTNKEIVKLQVVGREGGGCVIVQEVGSIPKGYYAVGEPFEVRSSTERAVSRSSQPEETQAKTSAFHLSKSNRSSKESGSATVH
jgi:hypothetical protein